MRYIPWIMILTLLLIATPSINSASSSLQQELSIQNMGKILYQDNFGYTILFRYGAESGELQPPWDIVGPCGSGDKTGSYVQVDNAHVRTGSQAVKVYMMDGSKSDAQRRVELRETDSLVKGYYASWWVYFPSGTNWATPDTNGWGHVIGGIQAFIRDSPYTTQWMISARFVVTKTARYIYFGYSSDFNGGVDNAESGNLGYVSDYLDQWLHFQVYIKWTTDTSGIVRAWFNDVLGFEKTGIMTDPEGYSKWIDNNCGYVGIPAPFLGIELYGGQNTYELWYWVDDILLATEKVPENYEVS